ncbi:uncharacterized protein LOC133178876 isoform X2 [Saccostrea echinata]|uniref:uncharacterized protein LOC133178876 isoform X2 n=1 Tax=Saccostrea echinata TaxID=191078 RepID=UPI002A7FEAFD|nr:uncharacterized protein LOC133178876 isoform X2 [Saccostrea echinata]
MTVMPWRTVLAIFRNPLLPFVFICALVSCISGLQMGRFGCYVCSYMNPSNDDFSCVTTPWNATNGHIVDNCSGNGMRCVTKTVYTKDKTRIYFMFRNCSVPDTFDCGSNCCVNNSVHDFTCQTVCKDNLCNNSNESERLVEIQTGSGATSIVHKFIRMTVYVKRINQFAPCTQ